jgi:hypothetical protein
MPASLVLDQNFWPKFSCHQKRKEEKKEKKKE